MHASDETCTTLQRRQRHDEGEAERCQPGCYSSAIIYFIRSLKLCTCIVRATSVIVTLKMMILKGGALLVPDDPEDKELLDDVRAQLEKFDDSWNLLQDPSYRALRPADAALALKYGKE